MITVEPWCSAKIHLARSLNCWMCSNCGLKFKEGAPLSSSHFEIKESVERWLRTDYPIRLGLNLTVLECNT